MDSAHDLHDCDSIIVKNRRDIFGRKLVGGIRNQQAGFPDSAVADHHASEMLDMIWRQADRRGRVLDSSHNHDCDIITTELPRAR